MAWEPEYDPSDYDEPEETTCNRCGVVVIWINRRICRLDGEPHKCSAEGLRRVTAAQFDDCSE